ncbi:unnamed protein product [Adineta steineri]|uniref:Uncharacterized protein n=1 Tax=Adineta steineri TaxID=433720 RepID=A0A819S7K8_9BILA|nr:unnamed protein product [Adineta steineri]
MVEITKIYENEKKDVTAKLNALFKCQSRKYAARFARRSLSTSVWLGEDGDAVRVASGVTSGKCGRTGNSDFVSEIHCTIIEECLTIGGGGGVVIGDDDDDDGVAIILVDLVIVDLNCTM